METQKVLFKSVNQVADMAKGIKYFSRYQGPVSDVVISSQKATKNSCFVAIKGTNVDGHDYITDAIRRGATVVIADEQMVHKCMKQMITSNCALILVSDTTKALQTLAKNYVSQFSTEMIGVTGSCGKTTTKEILASILGTKATTVKTPGNLNSIYGLPLSMFNLDSSCRYGVFEMGVDHVGEMDILSSIVRPSSAIITNICSSHLEKFASMRNLVDEKKKIFTSGAKDVYISESCSFKNYILKGVGANIHEFGYNCVSGLESVVNLGLRGWIIKYKSEKMHLNCVGWHSLIDCLGAIAVAEQMKCSPKQIADGVSRVSQMPGRSKVYEGSITVIDDTYNANFESSFAILDAIEKLNWNGRKNIAFGSMKELGLASAESHYKLGSKIGKSGASNVFLYGPEMHPVYDLLKGEGFTGNVVYSETYDEVEYNVKKQMTEGDLYLLKGSRVMQMERLLPVLLRA